MGKDGDRLARGGGRGGLRVGRRVDNGRKRGAPGDKNSAQRRGNPAGLDDREHLFVAAIVEGKSQTDAAAAAGYESTDRDVLKVTGYQVRHRPHVAAEITRLHAELAQQAVMTRREILMAVERNAVAAAEDKQFAASNQALKLLGSEQHGMFNNDIVLSGPGGGPIEVTTRSSLEAKLDELGKRLVPDGGSE